MRPAQKSNRSRGRGNRKSGGGGGGGNNINRVYDSAGPEGKVRGTPQQIIDKYVSLARDAQTSGDRVTAENFLQHAEHYQRILLLAAGAQEQARREAQEAATDQRNDPSSAPQPEAQQAQPEAKPQEQPASEIGGMAMIDAEPTAPAEPSLIVGSEEGAQSQPKRNGEGRRRRPKPAPEAAAPAAAEPSADPAPEAPAEG